MKNFFFLLTILLTLLINRAVSQVQFTNYACPNEITALAEEGNYIWIGTKGGIFKRHKSGTLISSFNNLNGLCYNWVQCITVDDEGVKWIGTRNGISKFDGNTWTSFTTSNSGLPNNIVNSISIDSWGNKWIATGGGGLAKFNDTTWTVYNSTNSSLPDNYISCVTIDGVGRKWVGTESSGVCIFFGSQWTVINNILGSPVPNVLSIGISPSGVKWITTTGRGLFSYDDNTWTNYTMANTGNLIPNDNLHDVTFQNNNVWVAGNGGVSFFNGTVWTKYTTSNGLVNSQAADLLCDGQSNIWIGTGGGISKYSGGSWFSIVSSDGLATNVLRSIAVDKNDVKWFGYNGGVSSFNNVTWDSYSFPGSGMPYDVAVCYLNRKWFITQGYGIYVFNDTTFSTIHTGNSGLLNNYTTSIAFRETDSSMWIGTGYGVSKYRNGVWTNYTKQNSGLIYNGVQDIAFDRTGGVWFATDSGVCRFDGASSWISFTIANSSLPQNYVYRVAVDTLNNKWFGTSGGLARLDAANSSWQVYNSGNYLPVSNVTSVNVDRMNNIWVGTFLGGICKYNQQNWVTYNSNDGLCNNLVSMIAVDSYNNKWISTPAGASRISCQNPLPAFVSDIACWPDSTHLVNSTQRVDATTRFAWDINNNGSIDYTSQNVTHLFPGFGIYAIKLTAANDNCSLSITRPDTVSVEPQVSISVSGNPTFCFGDSVILTTNILNYDTIFNYQYLWSNGAHSPSIEVDSPGNYTVTVYNFNCNNVSDTTIHVTVSHPYSNENICLVTVDSATNKNKIVWEKTPNKGTAFFNIYKETAANYYVAIGNLAYDQPSEFLDVNSDASVKSDRYKISVVDTCGNESMLSSAHKTMHLTVNLGTGNEHNLIWEKYEGFPYGQFDIWRALPPAGWIKIATIQSNIFSYTDTADIPGSVDYLMVINKGDTCFTDLGKASSGTYTTSVSNMEQYKVIGVEENTGMISLSVFPNPANDVLNIKGVSGCTLYISDATGRIVIEQMNTGSVNVSHLERGIYFVSVQTEQGRAVRRFVKE